MLRNAFRLRDLTARQVMAHRTRIVAAPAGSTVIEILELALEAGHTRIPLYQETIDNILGFVHVKDLFRLHVEEKENLAEIRHNVRRWIQPGRERELDRSEISGAVHQAVERVFRLIDLPTRSDLEALNKNLVRLTTALQRFEERLAALEAREPQPPGEAG